MKNEGKTVERKKSKFGLTVKTFRILYNLV